MKYVSKCALAFLCAAVVLLCTVPVTAPVSAATNYLFFEDFEKTEYVQNNAVPGWTVYNTDGDAYSWYVEERNNAVSYVSSSANSSGEFYPDETLTLPSVSIPSGSKTAYYFTMDVWKEYPWGKDHFSVYVSTTPITDPTSLTDDQMIISKDIWGDQEDVQTVTCDLSGYSGKTLYFAIRHHGAKGMWQFHIDNVGVAYDGFPVEFEYDSDCITVVPKSGTFEAVDGQDYVFTVQIGGGCKARYGALEVVANGQVIKPSGTRYILKNVTEKQEVSVTLRYKVGDISGDGKVNLSDAARLFYYVNGQIDLNSVQMAAADIDTYATVDLRDMTALFYYAAGLRDYVNEKEDIEGLWDAAYADTANGFTQASAVRTAEYYLDRHLVMDHTEPVHNRDGKVIFKSNDKSRVVNLSDGYAFTMPYVDFKTDYSLSALRSTYENNSFVLNVSQETGNPYGNNQGSWDTYSYEWLTQCVTDDTFLNQNDLSRTHSKVEGDTTMLSGYVVWRYDIVINDAQDIEMPYYSIAVIRKNNEFVKFHLLVMKSTTDRASAMDTMVRSFKEITPVGIAQNEQTAYVCEPDPNWNEETAAYYNKLVTQSTTDWGIFTESMSDTNNSADNLRSEYAELRSKLDFTYDIMPTYTHISWGSTMHYFPSKTAAEFAGGNGFNGKPVLQFTYQFTTNNNGNVKASATPMFDIARGEYDEHFRTLARDIKAYGAPVLFRLNNEMNTDWTSYCGMVTLLDPDFFVITWERLYDIFEEEGVDNCIWIFNPVAKTTPYCSWGEDLCYLPDLDTVHMLGLTAYEMGNGRTLQSFEKLYGDLYEKNSPYFNNYPQIISEFAAGAGGEKEYNYSTGQYVDKTLGRNASLQAQWVEDMFACLAKRNEDGYEFCQSIKGAVWFGVNDYATIDNTNYIVNYLEIHDASVEAFKNGLALHP